MVYRIFGGIFLLLYGLMALIGLGIPEWFVGLAALIAGVALLAGR